MIKLPKNVKQTFFDVGQFYDGRYLVKYLGFDLVKKGKVEKEGTTIGFDEFFRCFIF